MDGGGLPGGSGSWAGPGIVGGESECALWSELFRRRCPGLKSVTFWAPAPLCLPLAGCGIWGEFANSRDIVFLICRMKVRELLL